jgi:hypothetical protein
MRYAIVIENAGPNFSAYVPDLPGCIATGPRRKRSNVKFERPSSFISKVCAKTGCRSPNHLISAARYSTSWPNPTVNRTRRFML